ncbi:Thiol:disulfide oxidoreductase TlpA [Rhodovastum atsumiense]|uniref:TlpA family protein disulfide reductase n=1 Tax=Rhodovastum atsumiense TaxID=504468 RepID=A0A5M6IZ97_9PROT|nr:TlpA disulfide reductase family protein [Rhodovastum atsumiense]KAA5613279.1 TlpA family protein disulfide reductase [Rhodovastum atsumiense]CAH2600556.1 Thiol:disulfide oxidoreductase TlpA [Rhodovastum atsumiense]
MRYDVKRRGLLVAGAVLAGGTLAAAWQAGKPGTGPVVHTPSADPPPPQPALEGLAALTRTDPPLPLPPAKLVDEAGVAHGLDSFAGKGVVLNLWATWCVPCVAEMPSLAALARRVAGEGILVVAASSDRGGAEAVTRFFARHRIEGLPVWLDPKGEAGRAWGTRGIPTTIILDRAGRERARLEGSADWASDAAVAEIRRLTG